MRKKHFISVILPLKLEWEPCYCTDEEVFIGDRVRVTFAGKEYIGVVEDTDVTPEIETDKIKNILCIERDMEKILSDEILLWKKVSTYYLCSVGEVYKAAYPAVKLNLEVSRAENRRRIQQKREKTLQIILSRMEVLRSRLSQKEEKLSKAKKGTKIHAKLYADIIRLKEDIERAETARTAAEHNLKSAGENIPSSHIPQAEDSITLSQAQTTAYNGIIDGFKADKPVLLHGVTGSGKTEIYIRLAQEAIKRGKNVLYLVPEIALSRQLEDRLLQHFGERLTVFHSGKSTASRRDCAEFIRNASEQNNYIALCTRSGLFLPHHDLGLIIVDEEHDTSYKQDSPAPRYNGRDTALILNQLQSECNIILGSATPSLEEIYNTSTGRHMLVRLAERYHGSQDAEIEIIDTKAERKKNGMVGNFSRKLIDRIRRTIEAGEQVLILRSRRAWATALQCSNCGEIRKCPHCNVSLSYHKVNERMICHYCGHTVTYNDRCDKCGGQMHNLGAGTQKIEEEAAALFPTASIARLDSDTAQNKAIENKIIKDFSNGKIDILIGTQIIAKGFDFCNLSLVVIIAADTMLGIQDFRADEKALHLMEQFRGRCGRREKTGTLIIQTSQPEHPVYNLLMEQSSSGANLMMERKDFDFPPYTRIIELTIKDLYEERLIRTSQRLTHALTCGLNDRTPQSPIVTGPYPPVIDRISGQYIRKIRISLKKDRQLGTKKTLLKEVIADFERKNRYTGHISIDVDPA